MGLEKRRSLEKYEMLDYSYLLKKEPEGRYKELLKEIARVAGLVLETSQSTDFVRFTTPDDRNEWDHHNGEELPLEIKEKYKDMIIEQKTKIVK